MMILLACLIKNNALLFFRRTASLSVVFCGLLLSSSGFADDSIRAAENLPAAAGAANLSIPPEQFGQWLKDNGYAQDASQQPTSPSQSSSAAPAPPETKAPASADAKQQPHHHAGNIPFSYEQDQEVMRKSVPSTSPQASPGADAAFNLMLQRNMPLTPEQVVKLRQQIDLSQRAASISPNVPPKPVSTTLMVNLAPGTTPPAVRLAQGYVSALVFVDSTGTPWPIASFDIGNPKAVSLQWDGKSNVLLIQAISPYSNGDIVVRLVGLPTPVTLELVTGQRVVDYRVDIHVSGIGPNTKDVPTGTALPSSASQLLLGVLDGIAPAGAKELTVHGADCQAWLLLDHLYLRTRLTVLSPGWVGKMVSPDGMLAYELPKTSSVLVSRYGEPVELKIEGL